MTEIAAAFIIGASVLFAAGHRPEGIAWLLTGTGLFAPAAATGWKV